MSRTSDILQQVDLIRRGARRVPVDAPFDPQRLVDVCVWVEGAGVSDFSSLCETARHYAGFATRERLAVALAERLGNALVPPTPPVWPLLAILILGWRESLPASGIVAEARRHQASDNVRRGLAIIAHLFPELEAWVGEVRLGLPLWEKTLAVPVAARRLVLADGLD